MITVVILAAWSSGSTAISGYLDRCGGYTCPPHLHTNDARTPNAYEPLAYRDALRQLFRESTFERVGTPEKFDAFFGAWFQEECEKARRSECSHIVLKHPMQTFILPYLDQKLSPRYLMVTRPFDGIEATRVRRKWPAVYGKAGAQKIYSSSFQFLIGASRPFLAVPFDTFRKDEDFRQGVLDFVGLAPSPEQRAAAEDFLR